jgi:hypothetical protein
MIPPDEKAMELMLKYYNAIPMNTISFAKQFALIAVNEILDDDMYGMEEEHFEKRINYWKKVKQYIIKL